MKIKTIILTIFCVLLFSCNGKDELNIVLDKGENARIQCIYHKDGQESHPSCGVKIREGIESRDRDVALGWVHCFTCGASVPFPVFISNIQFFVSSLLYHIRNNMQFRKAKLPKKTRKAEVILRQIYTIFP